MKSYKRKYVRIKQINVFIKGDFMDKIKDIFSDVKFVDDIEEVEKLIYAKEKNIDLKNQTENGLLKRALIYVDQNPSLSLCLSIKILVNNEYDRMIFLDYYKGKVVLTYGNRVINTIDGIDKNELFVNNKLLLEKVMQIINYDNKEYDLDCQMQINNLYYYNNFQIPKKKEA